LYEIFNVSLRSTIAAGLLAATMATGSAAFARAPRSCPNPNFTPIHKRLKPLGDLISKGEGDYNAINRGRAGDTPGGIQGLTGMTFENYTVGQVVEMQRTRLYAVGRYQFIPVTLRFAVAHSDVDELDMFTPDVQDRLMAALILYKRPAVGALAKEWASIEYRNGRGFYDHVGGNRAHITRAEVSAVLQKIKASWQNS
jgi:hypothetical protein